MIDVYLLEKIINIQNEIETTMVLYEPDLNIWLCGDKRNGWEDFGNLEIIYTIKNLEYQPDEWINVTKLGSL